MSKRLKARSRRRVIAVAVAGLAMVGAAVAFAPAMASTTGLSSNVPPQVEVRAPGDPRPAKHLTDAATTPTVTGSTTKYIPPGAQKVDFGPMTPGAKGKAFQAFKKPVTNVIGGVLANAVDHPGVVGVLSIFYWFDAPGGPDWYYSICTGTVLSPTKVLTAAHCTVDLPFGETLVIAGRNDLFNEADGFVARVSATWTHQGFNLAALLSSPSAVPIDDVSVLTLRDELPSEYTPVTLTDQGDSAPYAADTVATIVGYGVDADGDAGVAGILRSATVPIQSNDTCATEFGAGFDTNRMVCAGDPNPPGAGVASCHGDSGGPLFVDGKEAGIVDWGYNPCVESHAVYERLSYYSDIVKQDLTRFPVTNLDWTGDGHSDLFTRTTSGSLVLWSGTGFGNDGYGGFNGSSLEGTGWGIYTKLFRVSNWNGDGNPAIFAKDSAGRLYQYKGDGEGFFAGSRILIGSGWNSFVDIMVTNNWTGDGRPNLMGRTATGDLILYTSNGAGGWLNPKGTKIGSGWNSFNTVLTPGSWKGDGFQSLIGRTSAGELYLYTSNGAGGWQSSKGQKIGSGWSGFKVFMSPGDWSGDNMVDLIGVTSLGKVRLYATNGKGAWLNAAGSQIASGWSSFNAIF